MLKIVVCIFVLNAVAVTGHSASSCNSIFATTAQVVERPRIDLKMSKALRAQGLELLNKWQWVDLYSQNQVVKAIVQGDKIYVSTDGKWDAPGKVELLGKNSPGFLKDIETHFEIPEIGKVVRRNSKGVFLLDATGNTLADLKSAIGNSKLVPVELKDAVLDLFLGIHKGITGDLLIFNFKVLESFSVSPLNGGNYLAKVAGENFYFHKNIEGKFKASHVSAKMGIDPLKDQLVDLDGNHIIPIRGTNELRHAGSAKSMLNYYIANFDQVEIKRKQTQFSLRFGKAMSVIDTEMPLIEEVLDKMNDIHSASRKEYFSKYRLTILDFLEQNPSINLSQFLLSSVYKLDSNTPGAQYFIKTNTDSYILVEKDNREASIQSTNSSKFGFLSKGSEIYKTESGHFLERLNGQWTMRFAESMRLPKDKALDEIRDEKLRDLISKYSAELEYILKENFSNFEAFEQAFINKMALPETGQEVYSIKFNGKSYLIGDKLGELRIHKTSNLNLIDLSKKTSNISETLEYEMIWKNKGKAQISPSGDIHYFLNSKAFTRENIKEIYGEKLSLVGEVFLSTQMETILDYIKQSKHGMPVEFLENLHWAYSSKMQEMVFIVRLSEQESLLFASSGKQNFGGRSWLDMLDPIANELAGEIIVLGNFATVNSKNSFGFLEGKRLETSLVLAGGFRSEIPNILKSVLGREISDKEVEVLVEILSLSLSSNEAIIYKNANFSKENLPATGAKLLDAGFTDAEINILTVFEILPIAN